MKLIFLIDHLGFGGAQRQMVTLATLLAQRGHSVRVFIYHPHLTGLAEPLAAAGVEVVHESKTSRFSIGPPLAFARELRTERYDAVLAFLRTPSLYAELAGTVARGTRIVVSERNGFPPGPVGLRTRLQVKLHRLADAVTVNAHHHREALEALEPALIGRVAVIYNGVDLDRFSPGSAPVRVNPPHARRLLIASNTRAHKNVLGLCRALLVYADRYGTPPSVTWAGRISVGDADWNSLREGLKMLQSRGLDDRVSWLGQRVDVPELMRQHDAVLHPSLREGLPNAICEALASGRPVLAHHFGDHPRLVEDGVSGYVFDAESPTEFATVLHRFQSLTDDEVLRMGRRARTFAERELTPHRLVSSYERILMGH